MNQATQIINQLVRLATIESTARETYPNLPKVDFYAGQHTVEATDNNKSEWILFGIFESYEAARTYVMEQGKHTNLVLGIHKGGSNLYNKLAK